MRAPAQGQGVELLLLHGKLGNVRFDRGLQQRDVGVVPGNVLTGGSQPVEPPDIDLAALHFVAVEEFQEKSLVAGAVADDHNASAQRPLEPGKSFLSSLPEGDDLGDHRVELRRHLIALGHAGVHADPRPGQNSESFDQTGGGGEMVVRVLGV